MKLKDWLVNMQTQGKISHEAFKKMVETAPDFDVPDEAVQAFEGSFMTAERASSHSDVVNAVRKRTLNPLDTDLREILGVIENIDKYEAMEISKHVRKTDSGDQPDTYKQLSALKERLPKLFEKVRVAPDDAESKKQLEAYKKLNSELADKLSKADKEWESKFENVKSDYAKREKDGKINSLLEKMFGEYTFGEAYETTRPALTKAMLGDLKSNHIFDITTNEDGAETLGVFEQKEGAMIPKFNGNSQVTVKSLLDTRVEPFLKKTTVDNQQQQMTHHQFKVTEQNQNPQNRRGANVTATV